MQESKKEIYDLIPAAYYPKTILFKAGESADKVVDQIKEQQFNFPVIAKPDIGMRGLQVKKIATFDELADYSNKCKVDFLVQEYVAYENEVGIFYYRYPNEQRGHISGIVGKELLTIIGDGISTVEQLLQKDKRYVLQLPVLSKTYAEQMQQVIKAGEKFLMVPYGNHARGAKFVDISCNVDAKLIETIDRICSAVNGFYFGRLDIRYNTWEELKDGKNFSIIELNGAGSEPTHIYDPRHSIFFAWREIIRHWIILQKISIHNHKLCGVPYMTTSCGLKMLRDNKAYVKILNEDIC